MSAVGTTGSQGRLDVGDTWTISAVLRDGDGNLIDATLVAQVVRPDTSTTAPTVVRDSTGSYHAEYVLAAAGRHTATLTASGAVVGVVRFEVEAVTVAALPTSTDAQAYLSALGATSYALADISAALGAEAAAQRSRCSIPAAYPLDLREALLRRVARNLAARSIPVATFTSFEGGGGVSNRVPMLDAEIVRLEAPYRRLVVG